MRKIHMLFPVEQLRYLRESERAVPVNNQFWNHDCHFMGPEGSRTLAVEVDKGLTTRYWWCYLPSQLDCVDPPVELCPVVFRFVDTGIQPGIASQPWRSLEHRGTMHPRLARRPKNLMARWKAFENKYHRVLPTRFQRLRGWLWRGIRRYVLWRS